MMKMKKIYVLILAALACVSCNDWLDVQPSTQIEKDKAIESTQGFRDILIGAYIRLKSPALYGKELTWGSVEYLAQHWETDQKETGPFQLSQYTYYEKSALSATGNMFNNLYKAIADVNGILDVIDEKQSMLVNGNYELIKGEALAIRAYCHFELLRLFGPMPGKDIPQSTILPYVKSVSRKINTHLTYAEYTKQLLADLDQAQQYLEKVDLILKYNLKELNLQSGYQLKEPDMFFAYRQMRMNYYAVLAQKARVYLWLNDKPAALENAQKVIGAKDKKGELIYALGSKGEMEAGDYSLSNEHILALTNHSLSDANWRKTQDAFYTLKPKLERYYSDTDIRLQLLWTEIVENSIRKYHSKKYVQLEKSGTDARNNWAKNAIPLIRLYEMYLIAMECSSLEEAANIWNNTLSVMRDEEKVAGFNSKEQLENLLIMEYNREFYAEGQAFYAYKRLGRETIIGSPKAANADVYVIPLPSQEFTGINTGN
ncbi:MAG: RagB/SusD family nutrient uptake outer membrane protein [Bacteroidia bacterium]|nr:RagB/SusD family nutrient uptake outer membrane protein [Bacteroidia bacterium]